MGKNLSKAFTSAFHDIHNPKFNAKNPHFKSNYVNLEGVLGVIKPACEKHGLSIIQVPVGVHSLETEVLHGESGESRKWLMTMEPGKNTPQAVGSAITYARRYMLMSIFGLAGTDDDGNEASAGTPRPDPVLSVKTQAVKMGWSEQNINDLLAEKFKGKPLGGLTLEDLKRVYALVSRSPS